MELTTHLPLPLGWPLFYADCVNDVTSARSRPSDRAAVERAACDLVLAVVRQHAPTGVSVVIEGAPGIGKTSLARRILDSVPAGRARILTVAGEPGRRSDPFGVAGPLLGGLPGEVPPGDGEGHPGDVAFERIDQLCGHGPVVLYVDDAHNLDAATLALIRRLFWASRSLPLAVLVTTRPEPSREPLMMLLRQAKIRLVLPPMGPMMVERLVHDQTGRWPGPLLRRILTMAAGNPLFVAELLRACQHAGALAEAEPDVIEARFELDLRGAGLEAVIQGQLRQLDQPVRDVMAAMAVWGTDIGADDLARLLAAPADAIDAALELAIGSGLIRRDPGGTVGFSHDLFSEVAYGELADAARRAAHRRAAQMLTADGYRPSVIADHLLRAAGRGGDQVLIAALHDAVAATRGYAPEVTAELLDDVAAGGADVPDQLLLDHADALFHWGRGEAAETLIRERMLTVTDPAGALQMQIILIRSLVNRADITAALAVIERTAAIDGFPGAIARQLEGTRAWLMVQAGQGLPAAELDAMMARYAAAGDQDAQASLLTAIAFTAFEAGRPEQALELMRTREKLIAGRDGFSSRSSSLSLPAMFELAASGPPAARAALDRARALRRSGRLAGSIRSWASRPAGSRSSPATGTMRSLSWMRRSSGRRRPAPAGSRCRSACGPTSTRTAAAPARPGNGWSPSVTAACRCNSGTTAPAGRSWPCWKPRVPPGRRPRWRGPSGPPPARIPAAGAPTWPRTSPGSP
jgi:hypothetical protein